MSRTTIVVLADPKNGEESLGRLFNALAAVYDFKARKRDVQLVFQGAGTRWAGELSKPDHPARALYESVEDKVAGASQGCAVVFGASADVQACGLKSIADVAVPGTAGLPSLATYAAEGPVITF